jgi:hypothetical protein
MKPGRAGTMTHDDKRNGTTDLFARLPDSEPRPHGAWRSTDSSVGADGRSSTSSLRPGRMPSPADTC